MQPEKKNLMALVLGERRRYVLAILTMAGAAAATFAAPYLVGRVIDELVQGSATKAWIAVLAGLSLAGTAIAGVLQFVSGREAILASEAIVRELRERLYSQLERLPCTFHDGADTGDLVQRCTSDVETIRVFLSAQVVEIGRGVLLVAAALPLLLVLSVPLTAVALGGLPVLVLFAYRFFHEIKRLFKAQDEAEGELTTVLQENLTGIRVVRAFGRQDFERERFGVKNAVFRDRTRRLVTTLGAYWSISDLFCMAMLGAVLLVGAHLVQSGGLSIGGLSTFLMVQALLIWPVRQLGRILNDAGRAVVALGRTREILDEVSEAEGGELPAVRGAIAFEDVSFAYAGGVAALDGVSFEIEPGEVSAFVGPPGSGKSTLIGLLCKLYEPSLGTVRLDGRPLSELAPASVRAAVGVVLQEPFLYSKTVRQNLLVGRAAATEEELVHAATAASIHTSLERFEEGFETLIGERGVTLSGGQRQRLAIARALLKNPPVLVLDDALSAVDTRTEREILAGLEGRRGRRTTLMVTHRLASVVHADTIHVLDQGRIVQTGTHAELVQEEGAYRRLWTIQNHLAEELALEAR